MMGKRAILAGLLLSAAACTNKPAKPGAPEAGQARIVSASASAPASASASAPSRARFAQPLPQATTPGSTLAAEAFISHQCVRQSTGGVWCWDKPPKNVPVDVRWPVPARVTELDGAIELRHSNVFNYFRRADGTVWTWGVARHEAGRDIVFKDAAIPERVKGLPKVALLSVSVGGTMYAFAEDERAFLWTEEYEIEEDAEYTGFRRSPPEVGKGIPGATQAADTGSCFVASDGRVFCLVYTDVYWMPNSRDSAQVVTCRSNRVALCARGRSGAVQCWAWKWAGDNPVPPTLVATPPLPPAADLTCFIDTLLVAGTDGHVYSWDLTDADGPAIRGEGLQDVKQVRFNGGGFCTLRRDGAVGCWGNTNDRKVGHGDMSVSPAGTFTATPELLRIGVDVSKPFTHPWSKPTPSSP